MDQKDKKVEPQCEWVKYVKEDTNQANLHHCPSNHYSSRERLGCCHGNRCWRDGHSDCFYLLVGDGGWVDHGICSHCDWGRNGELEEGERNCLPLHTLNRLPCVHLLSSCSVFHFHSSVYWLVAAQVIAILKLLVAYGADMSGPGRPRHRLNWEIKKKEGNSEKCLELQYLHHVIITTVKVNIHYKAKSL